MKVAILETGHFQYAITLTAIFSDCELLVITTNEIRKQIYEYFAETEKWSYEIIDSITEDGQRIIAILQEEKVDILLISPVFDSYSALRTIVKTVNCKKVLTTHNINTWFNGRFWSPNSLRDRLNMQSIIRHCDYIAVEDFIFNYLRSTNHSYFKKYCFICIPFTIFHGSQQKKFFKEDNSIRIALTGHIDGDRRRYEEIIDVIHHFMSRQLALVFSFAGKAKGEYGLKIQQQLRQIKSVDNKIVTFFEDHASAEDFRREMEIADVVISTSTLTFRGMGTTEYIGKTKPTAAIHDMMTFELPGFLPSHLTIPQNLEGSVFNYYSTQELITMIESVIDNRSLLDEWKRRAEKNSRNFTATEVRKNLPF